MIRDDLDAFVPALVELADIFDKTLSETKIAAYFDALSDLDLPVVLDALQQAKRTCKFWPLPVELRTLAVGDAEDAAERAWIATRQAMTRIDAYGSLVTMDPTVGETILALWGSWPAACSLDLSPEMWASTRKEWGRVWRVLAQRGLHGPRYLPGLCERANAGLTGDWRVFTPLGFLDGDTVRQVTGGAADALRRHLTGSTAPQEITA